MSKKKGTPAWIWVGCGCFLCIALIIAVIGGLGFAGFSWVKTLVEDMADPQARTAAVLDMLDAETLPPDYHARAFFNFPFLMELAILSDGPPPEAIEGENFEEKADQLGNLMLRSDQMGDNTLIYLKLRQRGPDPIEEILAGRGSSSADIDLGIELDTSERLADGELQVGDQPLVWRAYRGEMGTVGGSQRGIFAAIQVHCTIDNIHDLVWFQKARGSEGSDDGSGSGASAQAGASASDTTTDTANAAVDSAPEVFGDPLSLEGTPADPEAISDLVGYFKLCA